MKIPPVLVVLLIGALMGWAARQSWPGEFRFPGQNVAAGLLLLLGLLLPALGIHAFRAADTTVDPLHPEKASALVVRGIYRRTRNPMYLGFAVLLLAWGVFLGSLGAFLGIPLYLIYMDLFQIRSEEDALERNFGEVYREYRSRVRRWI